MVPNGVINFLCMWGPNAKVRHLRRNEEGTHRVTLRLIYISRTNKVPVLITCRQIDWSIRRCSSCRAIRYGASILNLRCCTANVDFRDSLSLGVVTRNARPAYIANLLFINDGSMSRRNSGDAWQSVFNTLSAILIRYLDLEKRKVERWFARVISGGPVIGGIKLKCDSKKRPWYSTVS